jgi:excisionase family DNA binding protein
VKLLTVAEVCDFLKLKRSSLYALVKAKAVPCLRQPGSRKLLFEQKELEDWLRSGRLVTLEEAIEARGQAAGSAVPVPADVVDLADRKIYHRNPLYR